MSDEPAMPVFPAALRWAEELAGWGLPDEIVAQAPESPWFHDTARFAVDDSLERSGMSARWEREVLPPVGGTVLDVGCGGGRSALPLVPPATELIGVDPSGAMLDEFVAAAAAAGVARRTVHGEWPDVAGHTPAADIAICHHVLFNVGDIVPFVWALTDHARLAVVVEIPVAHPMSAWSPAFEHFWGLRRPAGPGVDGLLDVLRELGLEPEYAVSERTALSNHAADPSSRLPTARRRLCLSPERDQELERWLAENPLPWVDQVATVRWAGTAEPAI